MHTAALSRAEQAFELTSLTGKIWRVEPVSDTAALCIASKFGVPDIVARVALRRGVLPDTFNDYSDPTVRGLLPDPCHLLDMEKGAARIARALTEGKPVGVIGDYDVDGVSSSALLARYFRLCGAKGQIFIPDRTRDGYGPCNRAYDEFKAAGIGVCVTVDCGISAFAPVTYGNGLGIDTVITDHHIGGASMPEAAAVINPNRLDEDSPHTYLAGAGVAFLFLVALHRILREDGYFQKRNLPEPDLRTLLDIVALATVCDVVPLKHINRAFVRQGLKMMARRGNPGLAALADAAGMKDAPAAYHLGFVLGPRINAAGRIGSAMPAMRLLSTDDPTEARTIAAQLEQYNAERKTVEQHVTEEAMLQAEAEMEKGASMLFAAGENWHEGVIGIVAGRVKERFHRPSAVLSLTEDGKAKGSARSVEGADVGAAIVAGVEAGILTAGGGHAMAGGFSVEREKIEAASAFLSERLDAAVQANSVPVLKCDAALRLSAVRPALAAALETCEPYGAANPKPRFMFRDATVIKVQPLGQDHLKIICKDTAEGGPPVKALLFRASEHAAAPSMTPGATLSLAGALTLNRWQGAESAEIIIEDAAEAGAGR